MREAMGTRFGPFAIKTGGGTGGFAESGVAATAAMAAIARIEGLIALLLHPRRFNE
jgi:hypothetical protein